MTKLVLLPGLDGTGELIASFVHELSNVDTRAVEKFMQRELAPDPPLDTAQSLRVSKLSQEDLWDIDREILAQSARSFRKVARIVGQVMDKLSARIPEVPDVYYAQRVRHLVEVGKLESQGDLRRMRDGEVRLPAR
jgi:hypothetical protein